MIVHWFARHISSERTQQVIRLWQLSKQQPQEHRYINWPVLSLLEQKTTIRFEIRWSKPNTLKMKKVDLHLYNLIRNLCRKERK